MSEPTNTRREGWGWPALAKKAHYFTGPVSLCGKWAYGGPLEQGNDDSPDNCVVCRRNVPRHTKEAMTR